MTEEEWWNYQPEGADGADEGGEEEDDDFLCLLAESEEDAPPPEPWTKARGGAKSRAAPSSSLGTKVQNQFCR